MLLAACGGSSATGLPAPQSGSSTTHPPTSTAATSTTQTVAVTSTTTLPTVTTAGAIAGDAELLILDSGWGFGEDGDDFRWVALVGNESDQVLTNVFVDVAIIGTEGQVVAEDRRLVARMVSGVTVAVWGGPLIDLPVGVTEVSELRFDAMWNTRAPRAGDLGFWQVDAVDVSREGSRTEITGLVTHSFADDQNLSEVVALWRNANGELIGATSTLVDVPAGSQVAFEMVSGLVPETVTDYEIYIN